jgi:CYTH domain-containing protein
MFKEFERKFLINVEQFLEITNISSPVLIKRIFQGYFWTDSREKEYRVRVEEFTDEKSIIRGASKYLTIKDFGLAEREELEVAISSKDVYNIFTKKCSKFLEKTRYIIHWKNFKKLEINKIRDTLLVEIEFDNKEECDKYIPDFPFLKEVTNDKNYYSRNLTYSLTETVVKETLEYYLGEA